MPRYKPSGTFKMNDEDIAYTWSKASLTLCNRDGDKLLFSVQANGLEIEYPRELAREVAESAHMQGLITINCKFVAAGSVAVEGETVLRADRKVMAFLKEPGPA